MAKLIFRMNQSLDGYVDHQEMPSGPTIFRHWIEQVRGVTGSVYGRGMYEVMRYWDEDSSEWSAERHEFADETDSTLGAVADIEAQIDFGEVTISRPRNAEDARISEIEGDKTDKRPTVVPVQIQPRRQARQQQFIGNRVVRQD